VGLIVGAGMSQTQPSTLPASAPVAKRGINPSELKADLDFLFKTIDEVHVNMYAYISEDEFAKYRDVLYQQIDQPMSRIEFYKLTAPIVAKLKNGHTNVLPCYEAFMDYVKAGGKVFYLELSWDGQEAILRNTYGQASLPTGGKILSINGEPAHQVLQRMSGRFASECKNFNTAILGGPDILAVFFWIEYGPVESLDLRMESLDGTVSDFVLSALTSAELQKVRGAQKKRESAFSYRSLETRNMGLIKLDSWRDLNKFRVFLTETFEKIRQDQISNLIIDLRNNPGGNSQLAEALLGYLTDEPINMAEETRIKISPQLRQAQPGTLEGIWADFPDQPRDNGDVITIKAIGPQGKEPGENPLRYTGNTFVLIGPKTASTSVMFAATVRHMGAGTLIGQETGDTTACYGDCLTFRLPNSNLRFQVACKYFAYPGGKPYGRGVLPHHEVNPTPEDLGKGVDTVLDYTLKLIEDGSPQVKR